MADGLAGVSGRPALPADEDGGEPLDRLGRYPVTASLLHDPLWSRFVAIVVWVIAALSILNLLTFAKATLDGSLSLWAICGSRPSG